MNEDEKVDKLFEQMQDDPTMGGTVRALAAAVMRLADENLALAERGSQLARMLESAGIDPGEAATSSVDETAEVLETAADPVPPDDLSDAEYVRLLHETALPLASVKIRDLDGNETVVELTGAGVFPEVEW